MSSNFGLKTRWFSADDKKELLEILREGDLLEFKRDAFEHWAVCVVNDYRAPIVVHYTVRDEIPKWTSMNVSSASSYSHGHDKPGVITADVLWEVLNGKKVRINNSRDLRGFKPKTTAEIVKTALEAIANTKQNSYDLMNNNCEHLANYCRYGQWTSDQVDSVREIFVTGLSLVAGVAFVLVKLLLRL